MLQFDPARDTARPRAEGTFVLYVEGPRDRGILRAWSYRLLPSLAREVFRDSVILGGRQPARAVEHFRGLGGAAAGVRALCVLDRDDGVAPPGAHEEPGLEFFVWSRRHIESYLLVPAAIRRAMRSPDDDGRLDRVLRESLPPAGGEEALRDVDAKRLLGPRGAIPRAFGRAIPLGPIARATRESELHPDVLDLFSRLRDLVSRA